MRKSPESKDNSQVSNLKEVSPATFSSDCRPFLKHFNRSDLPGGFSLRNDDCSVQRPESLDFTPSNSKYYDNEQEYTKPAAYVDWVSPVACE